MRGAIEPERRRSGGPLLVNPAILLLGGAVLASGALLLVLGSQLTFLLDDWDFLLYRRGWTPHSLLDPHFGHLSPIPIVVYKALLATFGMDSILPFNVVSTLVFLLSAVLLFVYLRRRIDDWLALISTTVILFLGAAWEDLLWPFQIGFFGPMTCGLGMLLSLEREDRTGDRLACVLLTGSMSFSSLGLPFAAGATVDLLQRRESWRSRIYIVAIPVGLYALWWLGWDHTASTSSSLHNLGTTPLFVLNALAAGIASLLGLVNSTSETVAPGGLDWGRVALPVILLLTGWRVHRLRQVPRWFWIVVVTGLAFWILTGINTQSARPPTASRYQYPSAIFILLAAAELLRGVRMERKALIAVSAVAAASLMGNITLLYDSYKSRKEAAEQQRAGLGAVEIARDTVPPVFNLPVGEHGTEFYFSLPTLPRVPAPGMVSVDAGAYLKAVDDFGSPAYSPGELATSPESAREAADKVLAAVLGIRLASTNTPASPSAGPRPSLIGPPGALAGSNANCINLNASGANPPLLDLPPGGAAVASGPSSEFEVRLRRFASTSIPVDLGNLSARASAIINIPRDRSGQPWKLSLDGSGEVNVCGRPSHGQ
ncbi:MAG: hypothetical protein AABM43_08820 [Actinomycetota bacterium]